MIIIFHFGNTYNYRIFQNGYIAVEFFFVVSGYLMARHVWLKSEDIRDLGAIADETWRYLRKKTTVFYSYYVNAILLQVIVRFIIVNHSGIAKIGYGFLKSIPTFTLTFMWFNESKGLYAGNTWYLSTMLIAMFILYPLLLRHYKFSVEIVFPSCAFFILGYLVATNNSISKWEEWSGLVYFGVLRAIAEMALGGSLFQLSMVITMKQSRFLYSNKAHIKILATIYKIFCYSVVFIFARGSIMGEAFTSDFGIHALLFCSLGILLSFSNVGYFIRDSKFTRYLGKISLPLFIFHGIIRSTAKDYIDHPISVVTFVVLILLCILVCIALMYFTDFVTLKLKTVIARIKT